MCVQPWSQYDYCGMEVVQFIAYFYLFSDFISFDFPQAGSQQNLPMQIQVLKPNELFYSKIIPLLKEKGLSEQTPRKDWPHAIQLRVLKELMASTPPDLLAK